jgi:hypothetical protein
MEINREICSEPIQIELQPELTQLLFDDDKGWLSALANREITEFDIAEMNTLIEIDSDDLRVKTDPKKCQESLKAREKFFGQVLGWDDEQHPLSKAYNSLKANAYTNQLVNNTYLMPLTTVINTERFLNEAGIDIPKVIRKNPDILCFTRDTVKDKMDNMDELGIDSVAVINAKPSTMSLATKSVRGKVRLMDSVLGALGSDYTGSDLANDFPAVVELSKSKLLATARLVAEHGNRETVIDSTNTMRTLLISPLASHLAAAAGEIEYSTNHFSNLNRKRSATERRSYSLGLLSDEAMRRQIGEKSIRAYLKNAPLKPQERERYPDIPDRY